MVAGKPLNPDEILVRCPRLGHEVPASYCLHPGEEQCCPRIWKCLHHIPGLLPDEQDRPHPEDRLSQIIKAAKKAEEE